MIEPAGSRKVVGKPLVAVSAGGMAIVIAMLCRGNWVEAITALLLTIAALEIMLHRALAQFDAPAAERRRIRRNAQRPAAATD
jgi:uncharacterized membrane protein YjjP (DUF1212 family)